MTGGPGGRGAAAEAPSDGPALAPREAAGAALGLLAVALAAFFPLLRGRVLVFVLAHLWLSCAGLCRLARRLGTTPGGAFVAARARRRAGEDSA